jgi:hypothetical protein
MGPQNIDTVLIAGKVMKRNSQMVGLDLTRLQRFGDEARGRGGGVLETITARLCSGAFIVRYAGAGSADSMAGLGLWLEAMRRWEICW